MTADGIVLGGTATGDAGWMFNPVDSAMVSQPDSMYAYFGWWLNKKFEPLSDGIASVAYWYQTAPRPPFPAMPPLTEARAASLDGVGVEQDPR